jgi:hypothetical protein
MSIRSRKIIFVGTDCGRWIGLTTLPPSVSRLSRECGIPNISQPYRSPRLVIRIVLLFSSPIIPAALGPGVCSAFNRNEYQKTFLGVNRGRHVRLITYQPSVNLLSRKCGILDISQLSTAYYKDSFTRYTRPNRLFLCLCSRAYNLLTYLLFPSFAFTMFLSP